jgi:hypothetical protein
MYAQMYANGADGDRNCLAPRRFSAFGKVRKSMQSSVRTANTELSSAQLLYSYWEMISNNRLRK